MKPGMLLFLPAYWWHEVVTEAPSDPLDDSPDGLTVSVNFWFEIDPKRPIAFPLKPFVRLELARQLESLVAKAFDGEAPIVPTFLAALAQQWRAVQEMGGRGLAARDADALVAVEAEGADWPVLHTMRPLGVPASLWTTLFEYVSYKAALLLSSGEALGFFEDLCDPLRFACVANALEA